MKSTKFLLLLILLVFVSAHLSGAPLVRIKDIAYLEGMRHNQLLGVGLVTGLAGKGDSQGQTMLKQVLSNLVSHFGIDIPPKEIKSKNCAVVMVSLELPPFSRAGERVDLTVSSIGDARSLEGGVLLQTNLKAANGNVYAVAQGRIVTPNGSGSSKTSGNIPGGALIERAVISRFNTQTSLRVVLRNPDFVTANAVTLAIRQKFTGIKAQSIDAALIEVEIPEAHRPDVVAFVAELESLTVTPDISGKLVLDPTTGIIIMGENVAIGKVAVSYKQINVNVGSVWGDEDESPDSFVFKESTKVEDFVALLREVGLKADVIIGILQAIDKAGALYGTLIVM